jgi:hypothetical protein
LHLDGSDLQILSLHWIPEVPYLVDTRDLLGLRGTQVDHREIFDVLVLALVLTRVGGYDVHLHLGTLVITRYRLGMACHIEGREHFHLRVIPGSFVVSVFHNLLALKLWLREQRETGFIYFSRNLRACVLDVGRDSVIRSLARRDGLTGLYGLAPICILGFELVDHHAVIALGFWFVLIRLQASESICREGGFGFYHWRLFSKYIQSQS